MSFLKQVLHRPVQRIFVFDQIYNDTGWTNSGIATGDIIASDLQNQRYELVNLTSGWYWYIYR